MQQRDWLGQASVNTAEAVHLKAQYIALAVLF